MAAPQRRAARLPAGALQALPSVSLPDDSSTSTLVLFVLLVVVINTGLLHTVLWGLFLVRRGPHGRRRALWSAHPNAVA